MGLIHAWCNSPPPLVSVCHSYCCCLNVDIAASIVVGNKNDCPEKKVVQTDDAQKFAEQIGIKLYETSAKENINVEEVRVSLYV